MEQELVAEVWHLRIWRRYKQTWFERHYRLSLALSTLLFIASLVINALAIGFATSHASNSVTDIILSNTPIIHFDYLFVYGTLVVGLISLVIILPHPNRLPFALHAVTLFFVIRALFVMMTHVAPFEAYTSPDFGVRINQMFFGADSFFSGHTGLPFLGVLVLWHKPLLRYFYLASSLFFAALVLLGHLHYTIDVVSAFFITFGIFHIALWLFPKEYAMFLADL